MTAHSFVRRAGLLCIGGALIDMAGNAISAVATPSVAKDLTSYPLSAGVYSIGQVVFAISQALMLMGIIGLVRADVIGDRQVSTVGSRIAVFGFALTVPLELAFVLIASSNVDSTGATVVTSLYGLATVLAALGLIAAGIGVIRAGIWTGWQRYSPLIAGVYYFVVLLPVFITAGFGNVWAISGWNLCFILLGAALVQHSSSLATRRGQAAQAMQGQSPQ